MARKAKPEIQGQALVQQNLPAILANSDSFASSSAWTAISCVMVENWCRNSPRGMASLQVVDEVL
jgi:hypothetical protein